MRALKTANKKKFLYHNKPFWLTSIQGLPYMKTTTLGLKLVYSFINFIIPLPLTYVRHFWCNCQILANGFAEGNTEIRLLHQKDCRGGTTEVNDVFKLLSQQSNYQWLYSWNFRTLPVLPIVTWKESVVNFKCKC